MRYLAGIPFNFPAFVSFTPTTASYMPAGISVLAGSLASTIFILMHSQVDAPFQEIGLF